jgi:hypothetical protein
LFKDISDLTKDKDASVFLQAFCSARLLNFKDAKPQLQATLTGATAHFALKEIAMRILAPKRTWGKEFNGDQKNLLTEGNEIFNELCFTCHNPGGQGTPVEGRPGVTLAPPLAGSRTVTGPDERLIAVLLKGLGGPGEDRNHLPLETCEKPDAMFSYPA